ncbi:MAG: ferritin family protein [Candidatus Omnitrophota bacterium]|nr:MAG: ferritin family protein [Candidatus Omnitrophota bacterium]
MPEQFHPQEIVKIAIKIEEKGKKLYGSFEEKATDPKLKEMWCYLKDQEEEHRKTFARMLEHISDYIVYEFSPGEYDAYLAGIASEQVFTPELIEEKTKQGFSSDIEAVDFGIRIEKDSIFIYMALRPYVAVDKQEALDKIIQEEKQHYLNLMSVKKSLEAK